MEVTATWPSILTSTWWLVTSNGAKGKCPGRTRNGRSTTIKPSPRALESMPSKPTARIRSDLFIALLVGIPAEMLPFFSEPERKLERSDVREMDQYRFDPGDWRMPVLASATEIDPRTLAASRGPSCHVERICQSGSD